MTDLSTPLTNNQYFELQTVKPLFSLIQPVKANVAKSTTKNQTSSPDPDGYRG